jgi:hypothetical protein
LLESLLRPLFMYVCIYENISASASSIKEEKQKSYYFNWLTDQLTTNTSKLWLFGYLLRLQLYVMKIKLRKRVKFLSFQSLTVYYLFAGINDNL